MITIDVTVSGPISDGRSEEAIGRYREDVADTVAGQGAANVLLILDRSIRQPTPYYETQVTVERAGTDRTVHDRGVIYGPWLEGVGSRNATTSFKGYHAFRTATQELQRQAPALAEHVLQQHLPDMGGG